MVLRSVTRSTRAHRRARRDADLAPLPLSLVIVAFDIPRELPRTLQSLAVGYQRGVDAEDYEVVVVDNGSPEPITPSVFEGLPGQFRLVRIDDAPPSPAHAVNVGLEAARGETVGVMLDGARLASPGLVRFVLAGSHVYPEAAIATLGWYLGYDFQRYALGCGWTQADEDRLLESIAWPANGYRLFEIATLDESSVGGWFEAIFESNALFLPARAWKELGGYDEKFTSPGGGIVNHDLLYRAAKLDELGWVVLLGEATFHQLHGGIATNVPPAQIDEAMLRWLEEYRSVRGHEIGRPFVSDPVFLGTLPRSLRPHVAHALNGRLHREEGLGTSFPPILRLPNPAAEDDPLASQWLAQARAAAEQGLDIEAMTFARWARAAAPSSTEWQTLLGCVPGNETIDDLPRRRRAQFHTDAGLVHEGVGAPDEATAHYRAALDAEPGNTLAYVGLSRIRLPGPDYYDVLRRVHEMLVPATYLEVGVSEGMSLSHARPPTVAVAVDPAPAICHPISVEYHLYPETSSEFFNRRDVRQLFGGVGPSMVFIDGLHQFPAVLEDFWQVEAIADPDTVVVFHDMLPLDEVTQRPERVHHFYTGDVWKLLHCLAETRSDLSWFTVRTPPSGLTFVTGLNPSSTVLRDRHAELVDRFGTVPFEKAADVPGPVIENDWELIADRLRRCTSRSDPSGAPATSVGADVVSEADLARRVRDLQTELRSIDGTRRAQPWEIEHIRAGYEVQISDLNTALRHTDARLQAIYQSRLLRWTRPLRELHHRLRHHGPERPSDQ